MLEKSESSMDNKGYNSWEASKANGVTGVEERTCVTEYPVEGEPGEKMFLVKKTYSGKKKYLDEELKRLPDAYSWSEEETFHKKKCYISKSNPLDTDISSKLKEMLGGNY